MRGLVSARVVPIIAGAVLITTWPAFGDATLDEEDDGETGLSGKAADAPQTDCWHQTTFMRLAIRSGDRDGHMISLDQWQAVQERIERRRDQGAANENRPVSASPVKVVRAIYDRPAVGRFRRWFQLTDTVIRSGMRSGRAPADPVA